MNCFHYSIGFLWDDGSLVPIRPAVVSDLAIPQHGLGHKLTQHDALAAPAVALVAAGVGNCGVVIVIVVVNGVQPRAADGEAVDHVAGKVRHGLVIVVGIEQIPSAYADLESPRESVPPTVHEMPVIILKGVAGESGQRLELLPGIAETHFGCPSRTAGKDRVRARVIPHGIAPKVWVVVCDAAMCRHEEEVHAVNAAACLARLVRITRVKSWLRTLKVEIKINRVEGIYYGDEVVTPAVYTIVGAQLFWKEPSQRTPKWMVAEAGKVKIVSMVNPATTISALRTAPLKDDKNILFINPPLVMLRSGA